jgi:hypothetical protein
VVTETAKETAMIAFTRPLAIAAGTLTAAGAALAVTLAAHGGAAPAPQQGSHPATTVVSGQQARPGTAANQAGTSGSSNGGSGSGKGGTGTNGTGTGGTGTGGTGGTNGTGGTGSGGSGGGVTSICQLNPSVCVNVQRLPVALPITDPPVSPSPSPSLPPPTYCQLHSTLTICHP